MPSAERPVTDPSLSRATVAAAALAALGVLVCLRAIVSIVPGLLLFAVVVWFAAPGVWFARRVYGGDRNATIASWLVGPVWGYGISSLVLLALWVAGLRGLVLLAAPAIAWLFAALAVPPLRGSLVAPRFDGRDLRAVLLLLLLVPLVVGRPFARVGEDLPEGRAYRAYFTADFIWRMAVAAELAKGDLPPRNPFYRGDDLRYYWLAHLLPAAQYREIGRSVRLEQILLVNSLALDFAFVMFLYGFVRQWIASPGAAAAGCVGAVLFTSFEGLERLWFLWRAGDSFEAVRYLNIDAVSRWFYSSLPVDGLHRLLMYQPHHSTGYALGLSALLVLAQRREVRLAPDTTTDRSVRLQPDQTTATHALAGCLLAGCLLLSTFSAIMLTVMTAVIAGVQLVRRRHWIGLVTGAVAGALPLALATALAMSLHYVDFSQERAGSVLRILVNPHAVRNFWSATFLSFGPMLLLSACGLVVAAWRRRIASFWIIFVIIAVSFLFYFFVDVRDHQYVYVGWRAGHMLFVAFAVLTAYALQHLFTARRQARWLGAVAVFALAAAATPTLAIDLYNTQDLTNRAEAAGFKWTLVLSPDELEALSWIRRNTMPDDIVQVDPFTRNAYTWAYVPAFAERRMAAGLPISMVPLDKYIKASERIRALYRDGDPAAAHRQARRLGIDYLIVGAPERAAHPDFEQRALSRPDLFRPVFQSGTMTIFFVERGPRT